MRALIVGCGYLGQRVAARWMEAQHSVFAVTRSTARAAEFQQWGWTPIVADICEPLTHVPWPQVDVLLFAVGFDRSSGRSQREVYVDGLRRVMEHVVTDRVIYVSSSSVYGQQAGEWVDETSTCEPTQPGGQLCLEAEQLVAASSQFKGRGFNLLRLSGIYGPGRLLSRIESLRRQEPLTGSPEAWLNLIHVDDATQAVVACAEGGQTGRTYLVSDDQPVTRGEYYAHLAQFIDAPPPLFDPSQPARRGAGGLNKRCANAKLKAELVRELKYPTYREGLRQALGCERAE